MSFTPGHLFFDDLDVAQEWESLGRTITEADIVHFAGMTGDFNPIHVDHEFVKSTPFRRPIAHGLLVMAVGSGLNINSPQVRTLAFLGMRDWSFRAPVFIGDTIRVRTRVVEKVEKGRGRRGEVVWHRLIVNQEGQVVQEGYVTTLVEGRANVRVTPAPVEMPALPEVNGKH